MLVINQNLFTQESESLAEQDTRQLSTRTADELLINQYQSTLRKF